MSRKNPFTFPENQQEPTYEDEKAVTEAAAEYIWAREQDEQGGGDAAEPALQKLDDLIDKASVDPKVKGQMKTLRDRLVKEWYSLPEND